MGSAAQPAPLRTPGGHAGDVRPITASDIRRALAGFLLSGVLLSFLGAILPVWQAHLASDFTEVGKYFLGLSVGIIFGIRISRSLIQSRSVGFCLICACVISSSAFLLLALAAPPAAQLWRLLGIFAIGVAAAILNTALFHALLPLYDRDRAAAVNLAGALFGIGCAVTALLVAVTFYSFSVTGILILLACVPGGFAWLFAELKSPVVPPIRPPRDQALKDLKTPLAVLLGLLLFFQFGNEWCIAGWLPVFLIHRLGSSPASALLMLACFWGALVAGRFIVQAVLQRASHPRLLLGAVLIELLGYLLLTMTDNLFGASVGILCLAAGFALTYPLVAEKIGHRFPHYHPGFFNGIFTFAAAGALLAPWLLGYLAQAWDIRAAMVLPLIGTVAVFLILLLIMLEAFLASGRSAAALAKLGAKD